MSAILMLHANLTSFAYRAATASSRRDHSRAARYGGDAEAQAQRQRARPANAVGERQRQSAGRRCVMALVPRSVRTGQHNLAVALAFALLLFCFCCPKVLPFSQVQASQFPWVPSADFFSPLPSWLFLPPRACS